MADIALDLWGDEDRQGAADSISEETSSCHRSLALSVEKEAWFRGVIVPRLQIKSHLIR